MAERRQMVIEIVADTSAFETQVRAAVGRVGGSANVAVASPVGATVSTAGVTAGLPVAGAAGAAEQVAVAAAMGQAQTRAAMYSAPTGINYVQAGNQASSLTAIAAAVRSQSMNVPAVSPAAGAGRGGRFFGRPTANAVKALGFLGAHEINSAMGATRAAEGDAMFAGNAEEMSLTFAQAYEQGSSGVFGSVLSFFPNLVRADSSPQEILRRAKEASNVRKVLDSTRAERLGMYEAAARRRGYRQGGESGEEMQGIAARRDVEIADLKSQRGDLDTMLNATEKGYTIRRWKDGAYGDEYVPGQYIIRGESRQVRQDQLRAIDEQIANVNEQAGFDQDLLRKNRGWWRSSNERKQSALLGYIGGETSRDQTRRGIRDSTAERTEEWERRWGSEGRAMSEFLGAAELGQEEFDTRRRRFDLNQTLDYSERQTRFRRGGAAYRLDASLDTVATEAIRDARQMERDGDPDEAARRRRIGKNEARAARDDYYRSFQYVESSPTRSFGQVALGDIEQKVRETERRIEKSAEDPQGDGQGVAGLIRQTNRLLERIASGFYPARVK